MLLALEGCGEKITQVVVTIDANGGTYPSETGCAPGYTCGFDSVCDEPGTNGYVCLQICDPDPVAPRVTCPAESGRYRLVDGTYDDAIGPIRIGRRGPL